MEIIINCFYNISIKNLLLFYQLDSYENSILFCSGLRKMARPIKTLDIKDKIANQFLYCFFYIFSSCLNIDFNNKIFEDLNINKYLELLF